jgi:hypothetical protein
MAKKIVFWVWAVALTLIVIGIWGTVSHGTFGDSTVSLFPTWYENGINIGPNGPKVNTVNAIYSQSFTQPSFTLSPMSSTSGSDTSTVVAITNIGHTQSGWQAAVGDACIGGLSTAPTSTTFGLDVFITGLQTTNTSTGASASATVTYWNGTAATTTYATGTLAITCFNTPY